MRLKSFFLMLLALPSLAACTAKARLDLTGHEGDIAKGAERTQPNDQASGYPNNDQAPPYPNEAPVASRDLPPVDGQRYNQRTLGWQAEKPGMSNLSSNEVVVVREGDTLYSIARQHDVTVAQLFAVNGLVSDHLKPGQHIVIPAATRR